MPRRALVDPRPPHRRTWHRRLTSTAAFLQRRIARALGVSWAHRTDTVVAMLENNARRAPGYWIQLALAMGIATFGLVLGSTAVVIGAMLVSPLMGPIVELGMGFAVGSTLLTIRAALRVAQSVAVVVAGSALLTLLLPFHEVTGEIAARTTPTALDLLVAIFCALTAAYTTVRATTDTTAAAAGTAIGIALVPPLCVVGYGLGTAAPDVATGAALLFTANFSAIVVFAVLAFLLLGYNWVDARRLERDWLEHDDSREERTAERVHRLLRHVFGSRYGLAMRLGVPALFLGLVYVPLSRALDEVAWQVRARAAVRRVLAEEAPGAVQMGLTVERRLVELRLLSLASAAEAVELERRLVTRLADAGVVAPEISVTAVADHRALAAAVARARREETQQPPPAPASAFDARVRDVLGARWPTAAAGPVLGWSAALHGGGGPDSQVVLTIRHLGAPVGPAGEALLASAVTEAMGAATRVSAVALPAAPLVLEPGAEQPWLAAVTPVLDEIAAAPGAVACVERPARPAGARARRLLSELQRAVDSSAAARAGRVSVVAGTRWSLHVAVGSCSQPAATANDTATGAAPPREPR